MNAAGFRIDQLRQLVSIGRLEFAQGAVVEDHLRQLVLYGQLLQHVLRGGRLALRRLAQHRQLEAVVEHLLDLLRRADIERGAGQLEGLLLELFHLLRQPLAMPGEHAAVDANAVALHGGQHRHQGHFYLFEQLPQALFLRQPRPQRVVKPQRDVGVLGGVLHRLLYRDLVESQLAFSLARHLLVADHPVTEVLQRQCVHVVAVGHRVQHVGFEHGVVGDPRQSDPGARQHREIILQILPDLALALVLQQGPQRLQHVLAAELSGSAVVVVTHRDIGGFPGRYRERDSHQFSLHRLQ
jgi:hypothetical protein